jgi:hypothetical protein
LIWAALSVHMAFGMAGGIGVRALMVAYTEMAMVMTTKTKSLMMFGCLIRARYSSAPFPRRLKVHSKFHVHFNRLNSKLSFE